MSTPTPPSERHGSFTYNGRTILVTVDEERLNEYLFNKCEANNWGVAALAGGAIQARFEQVKVNSKRKVKIKTADGFCVRKGD